MPKGQTTKKQIAAKNLGATKSIAKPEKRPNLLTLKKIAPGEILSCFQYMQVTKIAGNTIHLRRDDGKVIEIEKEILVQDSYSADHFDQTVTCSMTELAEILNDAKDTIFTVNFRCQPTAETVMEKLKVLNMDIVKNEAEIKKLSKSLIEGEETTLIGHLADGSQSFGRTLVIDLESGGFKQVDHRTI